MSGYTIVIPSKNASNLRSCLTAIQQTTCNPSIIVVDDGVDWRGFWKGIKIERGEQPFCFARNVNIGIQAAHPEHDIVILNDDALMRTPGGFDLMWMASLIEPLQNAAVTYGILSATTNLAGNPQQQPRKSFGPRLVHPIHGHSAPVVAFVCVYIQRKVIKEIGLLDEQFGGTDELSGRRIYGFDDNDYCRRAFDAGFPIGVVDGVYVDHGSLRSTFRGAPTAAGDIELAQRLYLKKWGRL